MDHEVEFGNVEYKRKLSTKDNKRTKSLTSQMQWRLKEGNGHAIYCLGVNDNGSIYTFQDEEEYETLLSIYILSNIANAKITKQEKVYIDKSYYWRITMYSNITIINDKKILIIGSPKSGKTSYLAYLLYGNIDNGNGYIRHKILRYDHEYITGETTSMVIKQIGCDENKLIIQNNYDDMIEIHNKSKYMITFFDVPISYLNKDFNLVKYMDHILILTDENINNYINICKIHNTPYTIINQTTKLEPNFYNNIVIKQNHMQNLLFLNILSMKDNLYLITCINYNNHININDNFYTFNDIKQQIAMITVKSMMYCNKHVLAINSNIVFTMTVETNCNLKKYKRNFFFKI